MTRPGAFTAIATTRAYVAHANERWLPTAWLPLPCAVLCQRGHDVFAQPVAVCVPRFEPDNYGGVVYVEGILRSDAPNTWRKVERRQLSMSIVADAHRWEDRDGISCLVDGTLISVDLVESPLNRSCRIISTTPYEDMSDAQRETQDRFDAYLAEGGCHTIDYRIHVDRTGVAAMNRLRPVVRGLTSPRSAAST